MSPYRKDLFSSHRGERILIWLMIGAGTAVGGGLIVFLFVVMGFTLGD